MASLIPSKAEIYGHLFENALTGVTRNVFWNIDVEFQPVILLGEEWTPRFACEWLVWPVREMDDLDGMSIEAAVQPDMVESTLYLVAEHHWVTTERLIIRRVGNTYRLEAAIRVDIDTGEDRLQDLFEFSCDLEFTGVIVVPDNFEPKLSSSDGVTSAMDPFVAIEAFESPIVDGFRYLFKPKAR